VQNEREKYVSCINHQNYFGLKYMCWSKISKFLCLNDGWMQCQSSSWFGLGQLLFQWQPSYGKVLFLAVSQHTYLAFKWYFVQ
jgi:hypothetical protein